MVTKSRRELTDPRSRISRKSDGCNMVEPVEVRLREKVSTSLPGCEAMVVVDTHSLVRVWASRD